MGGWFGVGYWIGAERGRFVEWVYCCPLLHGILIVIRDYEALLLLSQATSILQKREAFLRVYKLADTYPPWPWKWNGMNWTPPRDVRPQLAFPHLHQWVDTDQKSGLLVFAFSFVSKQNLVLVLFFFWAKLMLYM